MEPLAVKGYSFVIILFIAFIVIAAAILTIFLMGWTATAQREGEGEEQMQFPVEVINCVKMNLRDNTTIAEAKGIARVCAEIYGMIGNNTAEGSKDNNNNNNTSDTPPELKLAGFFE